MLARVAIEEVALPPLSDARLEWAGFTEWGLIAIQDSKCNVYMFLNKRWERICEVPEKTRVVSIDIDCVTTFNLGDPHGVAQEH